MRKKKTPTSKQRIDARYLANRKQGRNYFGCYFDTLLLQRFLIQDQILPPRIDDYSLAELKAGFAAYMADIEGFWKDAFDALDQDRKRVRRTIPIAPIWGRRQAKLARSVGASPTQVRPQRAAWKRVLREPKVTTATKRTQRVRGVCE